MIYTLTLNPSIDCALYISNFEIGATNRSLMEDIKAGGKGINISRMMNILGLPNKAMALVAGESGKYFENLVRNDGIDYEFFYLPKGETRINVKIEGNKETEINAAGPDIDEKTFGNLILRLMDLGYGDTLIISGSSLPNLKPDIYARIIRSLNANVRVIVDAAGPLLINALDAKPFLVKPNFKELEEIIGHKIKDDYDLVGAMKTVRNAGAENVIVSLGKQGAAMLISDGTVMMCKAKEGQVVNTIGAGDCLLAGFIATWYASSDLKKSLITAVSCGTAKAFSKGFPTMLKINEVRGTVEIEEIKM